MEDFTLKALENIMAKIRRTSLWMALDNRVGTINSVLGGQDCRWSPRDLTPSRESRMASKKHRTVGRGTLAQYQALIRKGGKQGCAAFLDAVKRGVTAYGFFAARCRGRKRLA
jgi:hypothetical protein